MLLIAFQWRTNPNERKNPRSWRGSGFRVACDEGGLMGIDKHASDLGTPIELPFAEAYRLLDDKRIDIDRHIASLSLQDPARDILWQELELLLTKMRDVVMNLAKSQATQLSDLRAKAKVLAALLRAGEPGGGPLIPEHERSALALSLTEDIARLTIG